MTKNAARTAINRTKPVWKWFIPILAMGFIARLGFALTSDMPLHPDEIMQYLEQAHRLVFNYGIVPWEYVEGMRSYIVPGLLAGILYALDIFGLAQPAIYIPTIKAVLCLFSLLIPAGMYFYCRRHYSEQAARVALLLGCFWYELIMLAHKPMTTCLATCLLLCVWLLSTYKPTIAKVYCMGVLCALVVAIRIQLAPLILFVAVVLWMALPPSHRKHFIAAGLAGVLGVGLLDYITWGMWWQSYYNTVHWHLVGEGSDRFGVYPNYHYLYLLGLASLGGFYLIVSLAGYRFKKHWVLLSAIAIVVLTHSVFGHKEYRFIFTVIPLWLMLAASAICQLRIWQANILKAAILALSLLGVSNALPAQKQIHQFIDSSTYQYPNEKRPDLQAILYMSEQKGVTGVLDLTRSVLLTGGYFYLHKEIPLYGAVMAHTILKGKALGDYVSHIITLPNQFASIHGFTPLRDFSSKNLSVWIWRRDYRNDNQQMWDNYTIRTKPFVNPLTQALEPSVRL